LGENTDGPDQPVIIPVLNKTPDFWVICSVWGDFFASIVACLGLIREKKMTILDLRDVSDTIYRPARKHSPEIGVINISGLQSSV
jgi:hypothetical protein